MEIIIHFVLFCNMQIKAAEWVMGKFLAHARVFFVLTITLYSDIIDI